MAGGKGRGRGDELGWVSRGEGCGDQIDGVLGGLPSDWLVGADQTVGLSGVD